MLDIILDYETPRGGHYGNDKCPILLTLAGNGTPDEAVILFASLTDK
jgi:hypothetical protein